MSDSCRISVDVGGSSVRLARGDATGAIHCISVDRCGVGTRAEHTLEFVAEHVRRADARIEAISVGFPGVFDETGAVLNAPNLDASWTGCRVGAELAARTGMPVFVTNDARLAALGEWVFGAGRDLGSSEAVTEDRQGEAGRQDSSTMVYIGLGTGIGGGVIVGGNLHFGGAGCAGELGHVVVQMDGPKCACGSRGCVEAIAGGAALVRAGQELAASGDAPGLADLLAGGRTPSVRTLARAARDGDGQVEALLRSAFRALGVLVANLVHSLAPDLFVFGGGWSRLGDPMLDVIRAEAAERIHMAPREAVRLVISDLEDRAGLLGGLALPDRCPTPAVLPPGQAVVG